MKTIVDTSYRTRLGVPFYDRRSELEALDRSISTYTVIIVYEPHNMGKSVLVPYPHVGIWEYNLKNGISKLSL